MKNLKTLADFDLTKKEYIEQNHFGDFLLYDERAEGSHYRLWKSHPENVKQGEKTYILEYNGEKNGYNWETIQTTK